jgi:hypothetical protein
MAKKHETIVAATEVTIPKKIALKTCESCNCNTSCSKSILRNTATTGTEINRRKISTITPKHASKNLFSMSANFFNSVNQHHTICLIKYP